MFRQTLLSLLATTILSQAGTTYAEESPSAETLLTDKEETVLAVARENAALKEKLQILERSSISAPELQSRMASRLKEIAADVKTQRQSMADFQGYVNWMSTNVAGYSRYIEASSIAANFARILPIPYAGQAGMFAKFVSHFTLSLSSTSTAILRYLNTSGQFVYRMDTLEKHPAQDRELLDLARFADEQLLKDMTDAQAKLATTAELSASTISFLESLSHYVGSSDEYWAKAKSLVKRTDAEKKEKSYLSESISSLRSKAANFDGKLKSFSDSIRKDTPLIKGMSAYNDLLKELNGRQGSSALQTTQAR